MCYLCKWLRVAAWLCGTLISNSAWSAFWDLDTSFGNAGTVLIPQEEGSDSYDHIDDITIGSSGKIYVGFDTCGASTTCRWKIARITSAGSLDPSFGTSGILTLGEIPGFRMLVVDETQSHFYLTDFSGGYSGHPPEIRVQRVGFDGQPDASFGTGSIAALNLPSASDCYLNDMALLPGGGVAMVGWWMRSEASSEVGGALFVRVDATGNPANALVKELDLDGTFYRLALAPDGGVYAASGSPILAKLTPDGDLDSSFASGGKLQGDVLGQGDQERWEIDLMAVRADGTLRVLATHFAGSWPNEQSDNTIVVPFSSAGTRGTPVTVDNGDPEHMDRDIRTALQADGRPIRPFYGNGGIKIARYQGSKEMCSSSASGAGNCSGDSGKSSNSGGGAFGLSVALGLALLALNRRRLA